MLASTPLRNSRSELVATMSKAWKLPARPFWLGPDPPAHVGATPFSCFSGDNIEGRIQFNPSGHILSGRETKTWVGYSFDAEKTGSGPTIRFTMAAAKGPGAEGMTQLPLPKFEGGPIVVAPGDIVRIPLLVNPSSDL